jgi:hypothetical protein
MIRTTSFGGGRRAIRSARSQVPVNGILNSQSPDIKKVSKNMYQQITKLKKKGYLKSEISRKLHIDPDTAAKYYSMSEAEYRGYTLFTHVPG